MEKKHPLYPNLFTPLTINGVTLRNRIAISAHFAGWWVTEGLPNEDFAAYIEERAKGGIGLFVIGATSPTFSGGQTWILNTDARIIPRYRMLVAAGHRHGTKVFAQLIHRNDPIPESAPSSERIRTGMQAQLRPPARRMPHPPERSVEELRALVQAFGAAAARAREGGVDGLELHAHEHFLHAQFLHPRFNRRTDQYGGCLENRMRFTVETLQAMRQAIGKDLPLGVRLKADDKEDGGMTIDDYVELVSRLEALNLVDYVSLTAGDGGLHHGPMSRPDGEWLPLTRRLKEVTRLPIMHAGRINTAEMAERALSENELDVVCMTKAHIADPHFARKVQEGRLEDIRYCTRCLQSCIGKMEQMTCVYNPVTSRERQWARLERTAERKRVLIVGAGPAGMEAALTAHGRGHEVVVLEKSGQVGGQVHLAAASPLREKFIYIAEFYQRQAAKGHFEIRFSIEATAEMILAMRPDAVIVATGSNPKRVDVPGNRTTWTVHEALTRDSNAVKRALVVDREGTMRALTVTDRLSDKGVAVEFITPFGSLVPKVERMTREEMLARLKTRGVQFFPGDDLVAWDHRGAWVRNTYHGQERLMEDVDTVVIAAGSDPINDLARVLQEHVAEVYTIGDANFPRTVEEATLQGARVARLV